MSAVSQLALPLSLSPHARFDTFVAGRNGTALRHATEAADRARDTLWLWGAAGCGKTHLLQAACRAADEAGRRAMYVSLDARDVDPAILTGLEAIDVLALDRVEQVAGDGRFERPLFAILDGSLARRGSLLLAARQAPGAVRFGLPDLASRAGGAVVYRLETLGDDDQVAALMVHARARGLELERPAAEYLQRRVARDMQGLTGWLERLDRASLAAQRKLTIPFIRDLLATAVGGAE